MSSPVHLWGNSRARSRIAMTDRPAWFSCDASARWPGSLEPGALAGARRSSTLGSQGLIGALNAIGLGRALGCGNALIKR